MNKNLKAGDVVRTEDGELVVLRIWNDTDSFCGYSKEICCAEPTPLDDVLEIVGTDMETSNKFQNIADKYEEMYPIPTEIDNN